MNWPSQIRLLVDGAHRKKSSTAELGYFGSLQTANYPIYPKSDIYEGISIVWGTKKFDLIYPIIRYNRVRYIRVPLHFYWGAAVARGLKATLSLVLRYGSAIIGFKWIASYKARDSRIFFRVIPFGRSPLGQWLPVCRREALNGANF